MLLFYNFLQFIVLLFSLPLLAMIIIARSKYRARILQRLGFGLGAMLAFPSGGRQRIWIHCLSVGEVTSALPLVREIRQRTDCCIIFSATTSSGLQVAETRIRPHVDAIISGPVDLLPVIDRFVGLIRPDLFILVETDFWPNWLFRLRQRNVPSLLVNGRISQSSFSRYQRFRLFFTPLFNVFSLLAVQTARDREQLIRLGVPTERITTPGNLKYGAGTFTGTHSETKPNRTKLRLPPDTPLWLCGSTHPGEEEILLGAYAAIRRNHPDLCLIIAPRDPGRSKEIVGIAALHKLRTMRRTSPTDPPAHVLILDSLGELADCYALAQVAFVGGSLVPCGGHNPLEAAVYGVPVIFGPHMDDFIEIVNDLEESGGGRTVHSGREVENQIERFMTDAGLRERSGRAALSLVEQNAMVISRYLESVTALLNR